MIVGGSVAYHWLLHWCTASWHNDLCQPDVCCRLLAYCNQSL